MILRKDMATYKNRGPIRQENKQDNQKNKGSQPKLAHMD